MASASKDEADASLGPAQKEAWLKFRDSYSTRNGVFNSFFEALLRQQKSLTESARYEISINRYGNVANSCFQLAVLLMVLFALISRSLPNRNNTNAFK